MARRAMSISKERKFKLESQLEILNELIKVEDFRTKEIQKNYLDKKLRLEIRLEEVELLVEAEGKKRVVKEVDDNEGKGDESEKQISDRSDNPEDGVMDEAIEKEAEGKGA